MAVRGLGDFRPTYGRFQITKFSVRNGVDGSGKDGSGSARPRKAQARTRVERLGVLGHGSEMSGKAGRGQA